MASNAIKRILKKDIKSIQTQKLNDLGIYVEFNESNMLEAVAMILGPPDSVYHNGILFFKIVFPNNYPYAPPKSSLYFKMFPSHPSQSLYGDGPRQLFRESVFVYFGNMVRSQVVYDYGYQ